MLKVSKLLKAATIDPSVKRQVQRFMDSWQESKIVPLGSIEEILNSGGYLLLQEDNTPWSGVISCPTEQDVRLYIPIGTLMGTKEPNQVYEPTGVGLVMTLYRRQSGNIEVVAYLS